MILVARSAKNRKRRARITVIAVILSVFVAGAVTSFTALGYYVTGLDTIYPNVWAEGIDMTGLSITEAEQKLIDSGYEETARGISITVTFPYGNSFTVTGNDVGLMQSAGQAAKKAFDYGRSGTFIKQTMTYVKSYFSRTELEKLSTPEYNTAVIRELAAEHAVLFNEALYDNNLEVDGNQITIIKGTSYAAVTEEEVYNLAEYTMRRAIEENTHLTVEFLPEDKAEEDVDLRSIHEYIHTDPVSSVYDSQLGNPDSESYDPVYKGATEDIPGRTFDLQAAEEAYRNAGNGETVVIPIVTLTPEITREKLSSMLYSDLLGERTATQGSDANRTTNIRLAAEAIDGIIIQPGETFSFNRTVGQRTADKGYKEANAIISGVLKPELGGGVCQVSSTIYAALLLTDEITYLERLVHGLRVGYLPGGQDATVSWGTIDFRFRNDKKYPIMLEVTTGGPPLSVNVKVYGTRTNDIYYKLESVLKETLELETVERAFTPEDEITPDPGEKVTIAAGNAGSVYEVWRYQYSDPELGDEHKILDANGNHVRELFSTNTYKMNPKIVLVNPATPTPKPTPVPPPEEPPPTEPADPPPEG